MNPLDSALYFDGPIAYPPTPNLAAFTTRPRALSKPKLSQTVVNLNVPHIHQLWDTPDNFDGHWACGATSSAMVLAYYGLLEPHPIKVSIPGQGKHSSAFGWYLSNQFEHNGHAFNVTAESPGNKVVPGIYGTVLDNHPGIGWATAPEDLHNRKKGIRVLMGHCLPNIGNTMSVEFNLSEKTRADVEMSFKQTLDGGHPVIVSGRLFSWRHIIVLRGYAKNPTTGVLQWIANDPFGYRTSGLPGGGNVVYEYTEINPNWMVRFAGAFVPDA
jgi:hypothetical protein